MEMIIVVFLFFVLTPVSLYFHDEILKELKYIAIGLSIFIGLVCLNHMMIFKAKPYEVKKVNIRGSNNIIG